MKKSLKILGGFILLLALFIGYYMYKTSGLSPASEAVFRNANTEITINYGSPQLRERLAFGEKDDKPVVTWGNYWRLGANEATRLTTNTPLLIAGYKLEPGTYCLYAIPHADYWEIFFNQDADRWGYSRPSDKKDLFSAKAIVFSLPVPVEDFSIAIEQASIQFSWATTAASLSIQILTE
jgi:hypothetical protein